MIRCLLVVSFALAGLGHATITAGWKIPIERIAPDYKTSDRVRKLDQPPGESAFFQPGDELWEISNCLRWREEIDRGDADPFAPADFKEVARAWKGEWIVWNSRSGMAIARGSWADIYQAEQGLKFEDSHILVHSRIELVKGPDRAAQSISLLTRSGEKGRCEVNGFEVELDSVIAREDRSADLRCFVSWPSGVDETRWEVTTGLSVRDGLKHLVARQGSEEGSWQVFATVTVELIDGTPLREARMLEQTEDVVPWKPPRPGELLSQKMGPDLEFRIHSVPLGIDFGTATQRWWEDIESIDPPATLHEWARGPMVNLRELLNQNGMSLDVEEHFAGFDPLTGNVLILADQANQAAFSGIISGLTPGPIRNLWVESNPSSGGWGLACRSGEKASIQRSSGKQPDLVFNVEPTSSASGLLFDLRFGMDLVTSTQSIGRIESSITLASDQPSKVLTYQDGPSGEQEATISVRLHSD